MTQPTFIGIGAQKCATTWIHDVLNDHPDIYLSESKEVNYFAHKYTYGLQWYLNQFPQDRQATDAVGEFSTLYFNDLQAPKRIKAVFPDIKLLLGLREPVDRLISNHRHEVRIGHVSGPDLSIETGIKNNPTYIEQGMYATQLKRWLEHFPLEQIHIVFFDDIKSNPKQVIKDLYGFLQVDPNFVASRSETKSNPSYVNRSVMVESIRKKTYHTFRSLGLEGIWNIARKAGLQKMYRQLNRRSSETVIPPVDVQTKAELKKIFSDDIKNLEHILNRNLDDWK